MLTMSNKNYLKKIPYISKFGLVSVIFFLLFSLIGRILFPFGDEPDFTIRAPRVLNGEHPFWSPYSLFHDIFKNLITTSTCKIEASPLSIWASIENVSCIESLEQIIIRFCLTIIIVLPLLYAIVFRKSFIKFMHKIHFEQSNKEWNNRLNTLSLTLLFPSITYYLGIFAEEQFILVLSLMIFLFWGSFIIVSGLFLMIMYIDLGNSIIVLTFIAFAIFFQFLQKKISMKFSIFGMLTMISFALILGYTLLSYLEYISFLSNKAEAMYNKSLGFENKYPILLRPIATFMSGTFMLPSGIKVVPIYMIYGYMILSSFKKIYSNYNILDKNKVILFYVVFTTILFFVFLFPDYGFAKYYVFLFPFIISPLLYIYKKKNIMVLIFITQVIIFIQLQLFRF